jgi:hypothetical protein
VGYPSMPEERLNLQPPSPDGIMLPGPQLKLSPVPGTQFPLRHADWLRLRRAIVHLSDPLPNLANMGWACIGIAASAATAYFSVDTCKISDAAESADAPLIHLSHVGDGRPLRGSDFLVLVCRKAKTKENSTRIGG